MIQGRILSTNIYLKLNSGQVALLSPDLARRLWQVDMIGRRMRFYLALNTPLLMILAAIEGAGGGDA